jgi:hypothetical protein
VDGLREESVVLWGSIALLSSTVVGYLAGKTAEDILRTLPLRRPPR